MNIFYLHHLPRIAAGMHCDKHVGKMLIESCQMLATAHHHHGNGHMVSYKPTHINHPSNIWARQSKAHYDWLAELASGLGREFFKRYGKHHKSHEILVAELQVAPPVLQKAKFSWQPPPLAMPDEYKTNDPIESYQHFYASKRDRMDMVYYKGVATPPYRLQQIWNSMDKQQLKAA